MKKRFAAGPAESSARIPSRSVWDPGAALARGRLLAGRLSLPFQRGRAASSGIQGRGGGASLEFHDHRHFSYGDDPRAIDWRAFARTDQYLLRTYREELRPMVDIILDCSASMRLTRQKAERSLELCALCQAGAERAEASPRLYAVWPGGHSRMASEEIAGRFLQEARSLDRVPSWDHIPWRQGALRIVISDLLFAMDPEKALAPLASRRGLVSLLAPFDTSEADPDWLGDVDLRDCETGEWQEHRFDAAALADFRSAYEVHFSTWREAAKRHRFLFARVPAAGPCLEALLAEAVPSGCFGIAQR